LDVGTTFVGGCRENMKRIVFLSRYQNTTVRGVETFVQELTKRLERDFAVSIFSGQDADNFQKIIAGKFDIVIPMNGRTQALKASLGRAIGGYKTVAIGEGGVGRDEIFNITFCRPNVFVSLTDYMTHWMKPWSIGIKVIKIPNGVDLAVFNPNGSKIDLGLPKPIILSVGALEWYKGHDKTIEAISRMSKGSLVIVGKGSIQKQLEEQGNHKLPGRFKIMSLPFNDIPKIYRSADVFTLPSWEREAFGIVYIEAMASNLPVVAPNDLPRQEIVGDGGLLVNVSNAEIFAKALQTAIDKDWESKPKEQAEKFSWDNIAEKYINLFENL
jgi:glycosyltransferase involved in cell wall biosynthesis